MFSFYTNSHWENEGDKFSLILAQALTHTHRVSLSLPDTCSLTHKHTNKHLYSHTVSLSVSSWHTHTQTHSHSPPSISKRNMTSIRVVCFESDYFAGSNKAPKRYFLVVLTISNKNERIKINYSSVRSNDKGSTRNDVTKWWRFTKWAVAIKTSSPKT